MNKDKQAEIQKNLEELDDLLELLYLTGNGSNKSDIEAKIKKKIAEIKQKLISLNDQSYKGKKTQETFEKLVEDFRRCVNTLEEEQKSACTTKTPEKEEPMDTETIHKLDHLEKLKDLNQLSRELVIQQNYINQKLKEDSDNIDSILCDTEQVVDEGNKTVKIIADTSRTNRRKRFFALQAGGTLVGGILGSAFGAVGGFIVTNGISRWLGKKHQKKLDSVVDM